MPRSTTEVRAAGADATAAGTEIAYIGLGANLGDPATTLRAACIELAGLPGTVLEAGSSVWRSAPVDASGPDFLNAVVALRTVLSPAALFAQLRQVELAHGRERPYRNAPRTLDLDLLLQGDRAFETPALVVPHPRLHERAFVLRPLAEIAPALVIPGHGPLASLLDAVAGQRIERVYKLWR